MTGKPMLFRDFDRLRPHLDISALDRVRVLMSAEDRKLRVDFECVACEDLLEWAPVEGWWVCPSCEQETTEDEAVKLIRACHEGLKDVLGTEDSDDGKGLRRWLRERVRI